MNAIFVGQSGCLVLLLLSSALGVMGCVEYWKIKDRKAAFISWVWGGLIAVPWLICVLSNSPSPFLVVVAVLLAVGVALWWQRRQKPRAGS
jgi:hypothetical protein